MKPDAELITCYVTDRRSLALGAPGAEGDWKAALAGQIASAARAGVNWIQLREKDLDAATLLALACQAVSAAAVGEPSEGTGAVSPADSMTCTFINDRLDIARASGAAGVHLGENSLPVREVVRAKGRGGPGSFLVGASCHSLEGALDAAGDGADYLFFGPVFATPSKAGFGPPQGLAKLREVCRAVTIPVLAIGGITVENATSCRESGAAGIAAIRLFQQAGDLPALVAALKRASS